MNHAGQQPLSGIGSPQLDRPPGVAFDGAPGFAPTSSCSQWINCRCRFESGGDDHPLQFNAAIGGFAPIVQVVPINGAPEPGLALFGLPLVAPPRYARELRGGRGSDAVRVRRLEPCVPHGGAAHVRAGQRSPPRRVCCSQQRSSPDDGRARDRAGPQRRLFGKSHRFQDMLRLEMNLSRSATRTFTDPDQAASAPAGAAKYKVLGRRLPLRVDRRRARRSDAAVRKERSRAWCTTLQRQGRVPGWPRGPLPVVRGTQMQHGDLMSLGRETESSSTHGSVDYLALIIDANGLERAAIDLAGREPWIGSGRVLRPADRSLMRLLSLLDDARRVARSSPEVFEAWKRAGRSSKLWCTPRSPASRTRRPPASLRPTRGAQIMALRARDGRRRSRAPRRAVQARRRTGRTLRKCCQQHLGMSPHQYLLHRRILLARRAAARHPEAATVTSIATRHGLELGRFSACTARCSAKCRPPRCAACVSGFSGRICILARCSGIHFAHSQQPREECSGWDSCHVESAQSLDPVDLSVRRWTS